MVLGRTVYLLAVAAVLQVSGYDLSDLYRSRIFNGHPITIEEAPYMVALQYIMPPKSPDEDPKIVLYCGASIIHKRFLLTAAHCFGGKDDESQKYRTIVSIGSGRYTYTNTIVKIEKVLCHEGYDEVTVHNDICLLKLIKPLRFGKKIAKIELADKNFNVKPGTMVNVSGWGQKEDMSLPRDLLRTTIPVLSNNYCRKADNRIDDTKICAGVIGRGACYGDSGGPLVYNKVQIGIVSGSVLPKCGMGREIYTKVNSYLDWIHTTIANNL